MASIDPTASVAPTAVVTGDVTIGPNSRILHGAVLNGSLGPIRIGTDVVVMEDALLRGRADHPLELGDAILVGPHTHLNGSRVGDEVFIATGASVFPGAEIKDRCELRINSARDHATPVCGPSADVSSASRCWTCGRRATPLDCPAGQRADHSHVRGRRIRHAYIISKAHSVQRVRLTGSTHGLDSPGRPSRRGPTYSALR